MKAYTDLEQSKKLAETLPLESADMYYLIKRSDCRVPWEEAAKDDTNVILFTREVTSGNLSDYKLPCWSLAALLDYLKSKNKFPEIKELSDGRFKLTTYIWDGEDCIQVSIGDTIVDACYEMITHLHELKLI